MHIGAVEALHLNDLLNVFVSCGCGEGRVGQASFSAEISLKRS